jgi:hypothetical protein
VALIRQSEGNNVVLGADCTLCPPLSLQFDLLEDFYVYELSQVGDEAYEKALGIFFDKYLGIGYRYGLLHLDFSLGAA